MIDKVVNLMPDTGDDSDDEGLEDKDSGIMVKFQAVEQRGDFSTVILPILIKNI